MIPVPGHEGGSVRYGIFSLRQTAEEKYRLMALLSEDELRRGNRLLDKIKAEQFLVGRGLLREALAEFTGMEAARIGFCEGEFGKPFLSEQPVGGSVSFNLSHAGSFLLLAVSNVENVGVDLEEIRRDLEFIPMARRYFSRREQEELFSLVPEGQLAAFYRCWTRKEAYLKGTGSGFSQPSTCFDVTLLPQEEPALVAHRLSPAEVERWTIQDLPTPPGYCAAIAVEKRKA